MDQRSPINRSAALLGVALAIALVPTPAAALSGARDDDAYYTVASQVLSSHSAPDSTAFGTSSSAFAMAISAQLEDRQGYDSSYLFSLSRGLADSTVVTPLKPPLFIFTIPLDIALLPFAAIAGFF